MKSPLTRPSLQGLLILIALGLPANVAGAQDIDLFVQCDESPADLASDLGRELAAIGISMRLTSEDEVSLRPRVSVQCASDGEVLLSLERNGDTELQRVSREGDRVALALRLSEHIRVWLRVRMSDVPREDTETLGDEVGPEGEPPDEAPPSEPSPEADPTVSLDPEDEAEPEPEPESEVPAEEPAEERPSDSANDELVDLGSPGGARTRGFTLGGSLGALIFLGEGDAALSTGVAGEVSLDFRSPLRLRVGAGGQVSGGGFTQFGESLETSLIRVGADLGYRIPLSLSRLDLAAGVGLAMLRVQVQGDPLIVEVPSQSDASWTWMPYGYVRTGVRLGSLVQLYSELRAGYATSKVIALSFFGSPPTLVGHGRFELMVGAEVRWGI